MYKIFVFFFLFVLMASPSKSFSQFEEGDNRILNQFIVMLKPARSIEQVQEESPSLKIKRCLSPRMNIYLVERNTITSAEDFLLQLQQNKNVKLAQFNHRFESRSLVPNDSFFSNQWNMLNTGQSGGIAGADIDATDAWDINNDAVTTNNDSVVIAIIDNKVDLFHEDLNYYTNYGEVPGNGIDDDGNGYMDDVNGWNVIAKNGITSGVDAHTMNCAGIAAAKGNNGVGVAGVCWGAKILPVVYGLANEDNVVDAYNYIREMRILYNNTFGTQGAFIVATNTSFGVNNGKPVDYPIWCAMYDSMGYVGILSAGATANSSVDVDAVFDIPTSCPSKYLISVTNTMNTDKRNGGAAYGKTTIDLGAPGSNVYSTSPANTYAYNNGTSMAAPHVAGAVAALYSAACKALIDAYHEYPDSISLLVKEYILDGIEWNSSLNNITVTEGRLNLLRAFMNLRRFNCDSCNFNIEIDKIPISCHSASDGAMAVLSDSGNIFDHQIFWSNGLSTVECLNMEPGFYTVIVHDTVAGCRRFASAELHNPDSIVVSSVNITPADSVSAGNITVNATAGNEVLLYSIDGINYQQTKTFSVPSNGTYTIYIKNSTGCVVQQSVTVSGIEELAIGRGQWIAYPNPADEELTVYSMQISTGGTPLQVYDLNGRKVYEIIPTTHSTQISTAHFDSGIYFLQYGITTKMFVVMH